MTSFKLSAKPHSRTEAIKVGRIIIDEICKSLPFKKSQFILGGSIRRKKPIVKDIEILIIDSKMNERIYKQIADVLQEKNKVRIMRMGDSIASILINGEFLIEFMACSPLTKGSALLHITGSNRYNRGFRIYAGVKGYTLSQRGLFRKSDKKLIASKTEQDIYKTLKLPYVRPINRTVFKKIPVDMN